VEAALAEAGAAVEESAVDAEAAEVLAASAEGISEAAGPADTGRFVQDAREGL